MGSGHFKSCFPFLGKGVDKTGKPMKKAGLPPLFTQTSPDRPRMVDSITKGQGLGLGFPIS